MYTKGKSEYESLLARKKNEDETKLLKEIKEDRSQKTFWEAVNSRKTKRKNISEEIKNEERMEHFKTVYCENATEKDPITDLQLEMLESWIDKVEI